MMHNKTPTLTGQHDANGNFASLDPIVRLKEFLRLTGLGRSTVYKLIKTGTIDRPLLISSRAIGWRMSTVDAFLNSLRARQGNLSTALNVRGHPPDKDTHHDQKGERQDARLADKSEGDRK